jgi:O-antigen/teichoic acid export membrane protein
MAGTVLETRRSRLPFHPYALRSLWALSGAALLQIFKLLALLLVARWLGQRGFGEFGMLHSTLGTLGVLSGLGLGLTATRYVSQWRRTAPQRAGRIVALTMLVAMVSGGGFTLLLFGAADQVAGRTLGAPALAASLRRCAGLLFLQAISGVQSGTLAGLDAFSALARAQSVEGLAFLVLVPAGAARGGLNGAVCGVAVAALVGACCQQLLVRREMREAGLALDWRGWSTDLSVLWRYSLPAFLSGAVVPPVLFAAQVMLVRQPQGYEQMALFSASQQWRVAVALVPTVLAKPLLSALSRLQAEQRWIPYRRLLTANVALVGALSSLTALATAAAAPWILAAYGEGFTGGHGVLLTVLAGGVLHVTAGTLGQAIASTGAMWRALPLNGLWALTVLLGAAHCVPRSGALGLAAAIAAAQFLHLLAVAGLSLLLVGRDPVSASIEQPDPAAKDAADPAEAAVAGPVNALHRQQCKLPWPSEQGDGSPAHAPGRGRAILDG